MTLAGIARLCRLLCRESPRLLSENAALSAIIPTASLDCVTWLQLVIDVVMDGHDPGELDGIT